MRLIFALSASFGLMSEMCGDYEKKRDRAHCAAMISLVCSVAGTVYSYLSSTLYVMSAVAGVVFPLPMFPGSDGLSSLLNAMNVAVAAMKQY